MSSSRTHSVDVCIAGGGPAGMMLGLLLAKRGIQVLVLEQNPDFSREYRGEVLMPRFSQMLNQIGLFPEIERLGHLKLKEFEFYFHDKPIASIRFSKLSKDFPFALWMPQPVLLAGLHEKGKTLKSFDLWFGAHVRNLIHKDGSTQGVEVVQNGETIRVNAKVTVGADGRWSTVRRLGGFEVEYENYEFDVVWFTIPSPAGETNTVRAFISPPHNYLLLPKYPASIQCGLLMLKGEFAKLKHAGLSAIQTELRRAHPWFHAFADSLTSYDSFSQLQAKIEYVHEWAQNGCLLIGDAAHTCSPAGAIGVSVAVGTALVAAQVIYDGLQKNDVSKAQLSRVQALRAEEVRRIHRLQKNLTRPVAGSGALNRMILFLSFWLLSRLGILVKLQKELLVMKEPLPIDREFYFS
jgi:2-polyprenyl-6-methoxyphenol hydroxylase-like FAD-dependent oxidoreductase